jgi:Tfp pilus assembly protein PilF
MRDTESKQNSPLIFRKQRALALLRARDFPAARPQLEAIIKADPSDADAWTWLSMIYAQSGPVGEF